MRSSNLLFLLCADTVFAASIGITNEKLQLSGLGSIFAGCLKGGGIPSMGSASDPTYRKLDRWKHEVPLKVETKSDIGVPGAKRIKIRSGPYRVPAMTQKMNCSDHYGMLDTIADQDVQKPCEGQCNILRQVAGLEYTDGKNANIDTGMWLHHMVHFIHGKKRWDAVARNWVYNGWDANTGKPGGTNLLLGTLGCLPFLAPVSGITKNTAERYFVSGNERSVVNYYQGDGKDMSTGTAYPIRSVDTYKYLIELMNMNLEDKIVYITMNYDILDGPLPSGWKEVKSVYLDANSCGTSEVMPPQETGSFSIKSQPWVPTIEGKIIYAMGHLHDGGVAMDIKPVSSSKELLCKTTATYSDPPEYYWAKGEGNDAEDMKALKPGTVMHDRVAKNHISRMPGCAPSDFRVTEMKKNQQWEVTGYYDYNKRVGNLEGVPLKQAEIMAIAVLMVAVEPGVGVY